MLMVCLEIWESLTNKSMGILKEMHRITREVVWACCKSAITHSLSLDEGFPFLSSVGNLQFHQNSIFVSFALLHFSLLMFITIKESYAVIKVNNCKELKAKKKNLSQMNVWLIFFFRMSFVWMVSFLKDVSMPGPNKWIPFSALALYFKLILSLLY